MPKDFGTPGPRAIYPDACRSLSLAAVSGDAERLFWRLVSQADDQGRLEGDAFAIKALCLPRIEKLSPRRVTELLGELQLNGLIQLYAAAGLRHLVQLITWWRWQGGMRRAYPSKWPAPEGWADYVYGHAGEGPKTYREAAELPKGARKLPAVSPQVAGNLPADSAQPADPRAPAYAVPVPSAGAGASASAESLQKENRSSSPSREAEPERADVQALLDRGFRRVTPRQRAVLDEILDRHDVTGPEWAAAIIRNAATDTDPLTAVKAADSAWQRTQREAADRPHTNGHADTDELEAMRAERARQDAALTPDEVKAQVEAYLAEHPLAPRPPVPGRT